MRVLAKLLTAGYLLLPLVAIADSSALEQAIDSTKSTTEDWGQVAKQKLQQGEAAVQKNWPKIQAKTQQELEQAKQQGEAAVQKNWPKIQAKTQQELEQAKQGLDNAVDNNTN